MQVISKADSNALRKRAKEASTKTSAAVLALSAALWDTYWSDVEIGGQAIPLWEAWGFTSWSDYVERELGIHQSTAAAYRRIHGVFIVQLEGKWDHSLASSYTKMKALCRVVNGKNVEKWLRHAGKRSCCELEHDIQSHILGRSKVRRLRHFLAPVTPKELARVNEILDGAKRDFPSLERRGQVLLKILEEWETIRKRPRLKLVG